MKYIAGNKTVPLIVSLLVILSSAMGLLIPEFYASRNNAITTFEIAGQDIVSLVVGLLLLLMNLAPQKGDKFPIVTAGLLVYCTYTYAYFSFGIVTSKIFILYLLITALSFYSILSILLKLREDKQGERDSHQRTISIYLIVVVALVGFIDVKDIFARTILSNSVVDPKSAYYVLDLAFLFPAMVIAAVMNMKGLAIGQFFSGAFLIKTIALMPALILSDFLHYAYRGVFVDFGFDIIAFIVMITAIFFYWLYQRDMKSTGLPGQEISAL